MNCEHQIQTNHCVKCGMVFDENFEVNNDFSNNQSKIISQKNNIIDTLDIPEYVRKTAYKTIQIKQEDYGKKVRNDPKNTFIEIYNAYLKCGYSNFNPKKLAENLNLSRKEVNWCLKMTSGTSLQEEDYYNEIEGYPSIVILSPIAYIEPLCKSNNLLKHKDKLLEKVEYIMKQKDILYSSRPEYIACAIVKKYCEKNNIIIKSFSKINNISDNALKKSIREIEQFF